MSLNFHDLLLKTIPYIICIAGGIVLFTVSLDNVHDPLVADLITNISASLLAIPLVFLLYDYTNYRISRRLQETMTISMDDKINILVLHIIQVMRKILRIQGRTTLANINSMQMLRESNITNKMRIRDDYIKLLQQYYGELENIIYRYGRENVLSPDNLHLLSELAREISHLIHEHHLRGNRHVIAKHLKNIVEKVIDWLDSGASIAMKFEQLLMGAKLSETLASNTGPEKSEDIK
ncbi:MAG: hypothetical protein J5742_03715 [Alphaproteobacteria bacterium]|nr:hypothetical protein [Alphaproteobacteria bacterium]